MREEFIKDTDAMEEILTRTADRCDIWQDRFIYAMAKAIWHLLQYVLKKM